ncbi:hypothetical protein BJV82DRAFT_232973 [Fennellomyces sp. T-0311]|nr:hypothetical protein BJV82DRAFT_232973 [Fennellomyces sp. T-0311]
MSDLKSMPAIAIHGEAYLLQTRTKLDFGATESAFEQGRTAYATRDYTQAIQHYTRAVLALQSDLLSVIFLHRAAAYEMEKDYERSLQDCDCANPTDDSPVPDPYFQRANALLFQNKLWEAALTYVKGADMVPSTCPQRAELVKKRDQLMSVLERGTYQKGSFGNTQQPLQLPVPKLPTTVGLPSQGRIGSLPSEVITLILSHMSVKSRVRLAMTCRYWHEFILCEWAEMWSTVDLTTNDLPIRSSAIQQFLRAVSPHQVRKLKLNLYGVTNIKAGSIFLDDCHRFGSPSEAVIPIIQQLSWDKIESLDC